MIRAYKDGKNIVFVTDEINIISQLKKIAPDCFNSLGSLELSDEGVLSKPSDDSSPFGMGTYHGLRPSDYINRHGVPGAIRMCTENDIPDDMKNEIKQQCATVMLKDVEAMKNQPFSKEIFVSMVHRYESFINIRKILQKYGFGNIENYVAEKSVDVLEQEYKTLCDNLAKRFSKALQ